MKATIFWIKKSSKPPFHNIPENDIFELSDEPTDCSIYTFENCSRLEQTSIHTQTAMGNDSQSEAQVLKAACPGYSIPRVTDFYAYASFIKRALCVSTDWLASNRLPTLADLKHYIIYEDSQNGLHQWVDKNLAYFKLFQPFLNDQSGNSTTDAVLEIQEC